MTFSVRFPSGTYNEHDPQPQLVNTKVERRVPLFIWHKNARFEPRKMHEPLFW